MLFSNASVKVIWKTSFKSITILSGVNKMPVVYFTYLSLLQDVRLIHLSAPKLQYSPGDVLMVCPHNASEKVDQFFSLLSCGSDGRLGPDTVIHVKEKDSDAPVPLALKHPLTLRRCAEQYWDLNVSMKNDINFCDLPL